MEINKTVRTTYRIENVALDMFTYDEEFRKVRSRFKHQYDKCFSCEHDFNDGEKISLAIIRGHVNEVLCHKCATDG